MYVPRLIRFRDMLEHDATRATEFWTGVACLLLGIWILRYWPVSTVWGVSLGLDENIGSIARGVICAIAGILQILSAGTKWVNLRKWTATTCFVSFFYIFIVYFLEARYTLPTPLTLYFTLMSLWVSWRIWHDKTVNGSDRRRFNRDESGHAVT